MSTIRESLYIIYNGTNSQDLGIVNCSVSGGMSEESLDGGRSIVETKVSGRKQAYFHGFDHEPLAFTLNLAFENNFTSDQIRTAMRWLYVEDFYSSLVFSEKPDQICYALMVNEPRLVHSDGGGYIICDFITDSPHFFGAVTTTSVDMTVNPTYTDVIISNNGDLIIPTLIIVTKVGTTGNINILNLANSDEIILTGAEVGQTILVNGESEDVSSSPRGAITFTGVVADGEIVSVGGRNFEFDTNSSVISGNVAINVSASQTASSAVTALVSSVNSDVGSDYRAIDSAGDVVVIFTDSSEVDGDSYATTETCVNGSFASTTLVNVYPYNIWNSEILSLAIGTNTIRVTGTVLITFRYQAQLLAGS